MNTSYGPLWLGHRRSLFRLALSCLAGGVVRRLAASPATSVMEDLARQNGGATSTCTACSYTVNATVTFAGISLFSKKNVGGAFLSIENSAAPDASVTALQFAAGSWPERLKGFNRFGMTQEIVREQGGAVAESAYISFMSSSPEKDLAEARQAFASQAVVPLTIALGRSSAQGSCAQVQHDKVPGAYTWRNCQDIANRLRSQVPASLAPALSVAPILPTFLFAVRRAMLADDGVPVRYAHNARLYHVKTRIERHPNSDHVAVTGTISSESERGQTEFNLWLRADNRSALPIRIQWRARSFLVLTLEASEQLHAPTLHSLLNQERA
ncbi:MAG: hypothetical protein JO051_04235 [Acidobacteriaceae bacterium]|nr:hypothetical protein [Acidobacteriaceae bacterium]